ncbi:MAG: membrane protein insertion efficiency factor YidD [Terriglobales bacterium]
MAIAANLPRVTLLSALRAYKYAISPLFLPSCRYVPTCSEYAAEALERHGAIRGTLMAMWRLLKCNPFVKGGFDPVSELHESNAQADEDARDFRGQECPRHTACANTH